MGSGHVDVATRPKRADGVPALARIGRGPGPTGSLEFVTIGSATLAGLTPQAIGLTYWFDAAESGKPYQVAVRFTGKRLDVTGRRGPGDDFQVAASLRRVLPGSGRVALTHRVTGKTPGRWHVVAEGMVVPQVAGRARPVTLPKASATGFSTYSPIARMRAPGVVLGAWPAAVGLGVIGGLSLQAVLAGIHRLPVARVFLLALAASVLGVVGAKVYYRLTHLREKGGLLAAGMSVQGFVLTAVVVFVAGGSAAGVPIGHLLDATVPALLLGQAIGRLGCFFGGCCAGLPTHSRWGLWSSDRRVGTRRIPVQLMESALAGLLALVTGVIALQGPSRGDGLLFVGGLAAYVLGRQLLFPLRGVPRATAHGRQITLAASAAVVLTSIAVAVAG